MANTHTARVNAYFTQAQLDFLRQWGETQIIEGDAIIIRSALRQLFKASFPADPPAHGGNRGSRPNTSDWVCVKRDTYSLSFDDHTGRKVEAGEVGDVVERKREGLLVRFGVWTPEDPHIELLKYRDLEVVLEDELSGREETYALYYNIGHEPASQKRNPDKFVGRGENVLIRFLETAQTYQNPWKIIRVRDGEVIHRSEGS